MCVESSEDDRRHSSHEGYACFFRYSSKGNISISHLDYIPLELPQQDLWRYLWRLPTTHDASSCGSKN